MPLNIIYDLITSVCTMPLPWLEAAVACCLIGMVSNACNIRSYRRGDDLLCD